MSPPGAEPLAKASRACLLLCGIPALLGYATSSAAATACKGDVALQILGSGGPVPEGHRASSGYFISIGGHSRVLVDAGGGVFLRFGEAQARIEDLRVSLVGASPPETTFPTACRKDGRRTPQSRRPRTATFGPAESK